MAATREVLTGPEGFTFKEMPGKRVITGVSCLGRENVTVALIPWRIDMPDRTQGFIITAQVTNGDHNPIFIEDPIKTHKDYKQAIEAEKRLQADFGGCPYEVIEYAFILKQSNDPPGQVSLRQNAYIDIAKKIIEEKPDLLDQLRPLIIQRRRNRLVYPFPHLTPQSFHDIV